MELLSLLSSQDFRKEACLTSHFAFDSQVPESIEPDDKYGVNYNPYKR